MRIVSITPYNFRNLDNSTLTFADGTNVFLGRNGQGKTSIIEAMHVLSFTKSFRTARYQELRRWSEPDCSVFGEIERAGGTAKLGVLFHSDEREFYINEQRINSAVDYIGRFICVTFSPTDLALIQGSPGERRRFLDKHIIDINPLMARQYVEYSRALRNKQAILKSGRANPADLEPWNQLIAERAVSIIQARDEFASELQRRARRFHELFCHGAQEISCSIDNSIQESSELSAESILRAINQVQDREIRTQRAVIGPHRDDLLVTLGGQDTRRFASQGQARSIVLSFKLAVLELIGERLGDLPVTLLDDVDSELDKQRSADFFQTLFEFSSQIFITTTDARQSFLRDRIGATFWNVDGGKVTQN